MSGGQSHRCDFPNASPELGQSTIGAASQQRPPNDYTELTNTKSLCVEFLREHPGFRPFNSAGLQLFKEDFSMDFGGGGHDSATHINVKASSKMSAEAGCFYAQGALSPASSGTRKRWRGAPGEKASQGSAPSRAAGFSATSSPSRCRNRGWAHPAGRNRSSPEGEGQGLSIRSRYSRYCQDGSPRRRIA